jgi:hypothetical protein
VEDIKQEHFTMFGPDENTQEADIISQLHPGHATRPEHLFSGYVPLEAKVKGL